MERIGVSRSGCGEGARSSLHVNSVPSKSIESREKPNGSLPCFEG